ncbi:MAG: hypothetical protein PUF56_07440, partial [Lachnospiraceae bacterium]|nr:hypothetical protein [Lachnospiraceae bacterium]
GEKQIVFPKMICYNSLLSARVFSARFRKSVRTAVSVCERIHVSGIDQALLNQGGINKQNERTGRKLRAQYGQADRHC